MTFLFRPRRMGAVRAGSQKFGGRSRIAPAHFEGIRSGGDSRVGCRSTSCSDLCRGGGGTNGSGNGGGGLWTSGPPAWVRVLCSRFSLGSCFCGCGCEFACFGVFVVSI